MTHMTYRLLNRDRKVKRAQRTLRKQLRQHVSLFAAAAFIGNACLGRTHE